ncbi:MAG: ABC transporter ATP-binding protein [Reyranellaceae bacterium]
MLAVDSIGMNFGGLVVLRDVSFAIAEGELVGLVGPNGAGKTTLFNIISGYQRPTAGRVAWQGVTVTGMAPHRLAERGLVRTFQGARVFPKLTVRECLAVAHHLTGARKQAAALADEALATFGLDRHADEMAGALPTGMMRTLGIAMALATGAKLLMLDEPAAGLSAEEIAHLRTVILQAHGRGTTLCVIEHNLRFLMGLVQRACVLHAGSLIADGPPETVTRDQRVIEAYLGDALADG